MEGLLNAANVSTDKFIMGELPVNSGEVSIMTVKELFDALKKDAAYTSLEYSSISSYDSVNDRSPNPIYYAYGIVGGEGLDSTPENLKAVGLDWYRQMNKPKSYNQVFSVNDQKLFGGPLSEIDHTKSDDAYRFYWRYSVGSGYYSHTSNYWDNDVFSSIYVAVVHS